MYADTRYKPVADGVKSVVVGIMVVRPVICLLATMVGATGPAGVAAERLPRLKAEIAKRRAAAHRVLYMDTPLLKFLGRVES
jgi:hypothetical protein